MNTQDGVKHLPNCSVVCPGCWEESSNYQPQIIHKDDTLEKNLANIIEKSKRESEEK
jgi:hypothetical protein